MLCLIIKYCVRHLRSFEYDHKLPVNTETESQHSYIIPRLMRESNPQGFATQIVRAKLTPLGHCAPML